MSQLKVNSIVPVGGLPSGSNGGIIQVVQTYKTDTTSQVGSSGTDSATLYYDISGMSVTITPSSASNKILIDTTFQVSSSHTDRNNSVRLLRGSTVIGNSTGGSAYQGLIRDKTIKFQVRNYNIKFLDSPATTSAVTYKLAWQLERSGSSATTYYLNRGDGGSQGAVSHITAMEVTV
jgi:hypothetical protein